MIKFNLPTVYVRREGNGPGGENVQGECPIWSRNCRLAVDQNFAV